MIRESQQSTALLGITMYTLLFTLVALVLIELIVDQLEEIDERNGLIKVSEKLSELDPKEIDLHQLSIMEDLGFLDVYKDYNTLPDFLSEYNKPGVYTPNNQSTLLVHHNPESLALTYYLLRYELDSDEDNWFDNEEAVNCIILLFTTLLAVTLRVYIRSLTMKPVVVLKHRTTHITPEEYRRNSNTKFYENSVLNYEIPGDDLWINSYNGRKRQFLGSAYEKLRVQASKLRRALDILFRRVFKRIFSLPSLERANKTPSQLELLFRGTLRTTQLGFGERRTSTTTQNIVNEIDRNNAITLFVTPAIFTLVIVLLVVFVLTDGTLDRTSYWNIQVNFFHSLNSYFSRYPNVWANLTQLGDAHILFPLLSFYLIVRPATFVSLFGAIPLVTILTHGGKMLTSIPRPAAVLDQQSFNIVGDTLTGFNSFPSGHTSTVFAATTILVLITFSSTKGYTRWTMVITGIIIASILGISRVAVGAHWPLDIVVGALCGYLGGISGIALTQWHTTWWNWISLQQYQLYIGLTLLLWSVSLIPPFSDGYYSTLPIVWFSSITGVLTSVHLIARHFNRHV